MSDKYRRVEKPRSEISPPIASNEVRITATGKRKNYITYALNKLNGSPASTETNDKGETVNLPEQKPERSIVLRAMGRAMTKAVTVAEIVKRRVGGLHQITAIDSSEITDTWEPLEEGLKTVVTTRKVASITITLSKDPLDANSPGYQPPLPADQVQERKQGEKPETARRGGRGRGRGRGGRGRGRGRGRGGRGGANKAGGNGNNNNNNNNNNAPSSAQAESGGNTSARRGRGGGRDRGRGGRGRGGRGRGGNRGGATASTKTE